MKEYQEETNNKDEDNEKLNPVKFESFNISLPEQEIPLPKQNTKRNLYLLIILVIIIIIIIICFLASSEKEITCPKGYFIPNDANDKSKCMKCSVENCEVCSGEILSNICTSCKQYLTPIFENEKIKYCKYTCEIGLNEKCAKCDEIKNECSSCNIGYKLKEGKCILNYSFKATYLSEYKNQNIKLINNFPNSISNMIVDDIDIQSPSKNYTFSVPGNHTIYFLVDISNLSSLDSLFKDCNKIVSISFTELFSTSHIKNMSHMFDYLTLLTSLDISKFNTKEVLDMSGMFATCLKLTSLDISNFDTSKVTDMHEIFKQNSLLTSLNLNNFDTKNVLDMSYMFSGCDKLYKYNFEI